VKAPGAEDKIPKHLKNIYLTNREDAKNAKEDGEEDS
jgi:hypothetical protein